MVDREKRVNVRVSEAEALKLGVLAEAAGVSQSDFLRLYIAKAYEERFPEKAKQNKR